jgi:predicted small secreted protein
VRNPAAILALLLWVATLAGCNTMEGFGQDLEALGNKIESKAKKEKQD